VQHGLGGTEQRRRFVMVKRETEKQNRGQLLDFRLPSRRRPRSRAFLIWYELRELVFSNKSVSSKHPICVGEKNKKTLVLKEAELCWAISFTHVAVRM
jgi:hypothetical protein